MWVIAKIKSKQVDIFKKNCINILTKNKSFGLIGGISLNQKDEIENLKDKNSHHYR